MATTSSPPSSPTGSDPPARARSRWARRLAGWLPAVVLVPLALVAGVRATAPSDDVAAMRGVYPLDVGTTWTYAVSDHGKASGTHVAQVVGQAHLLQGRASLIDAVRLRNDYTALPGRGAQRTTTYLAVEGDTVRQYGVTSATHQYQELDPAAVVARRPVRVGDVQRFDGTFGGSAYQQATRVVATLDVTVGGTTFRDCQHLVTDVPVKAADGTTTHEVLEEWDCPGIGAVRTSDRYDAGDYLVTEELTSFHGAADSWSATPAAAVKPVVGTSAVGSTVGFGAGRAYAVPGAVGSGVGSRLAWADERSATSTFAPVGDGDVMVTGEQDGDVAARDLATGAVRWQVRLAQPVLITPVVVDGLVLVADSTKRLWALSTADGSARWEHTFDDVLTASPAAAGGRVAVATDDGRLTGLDLADGHVAWSTTLGGTAVGPPATDGIRLAVGDSSGSMSVLDLATGAVDWSTSVPDGLAAGPVLADGRLLVPDQDGVVWSWRAADGDLQWQSRSHGLVSGALAVDDEVVVSVLGRGEVDAFDLSDGGRAWHRNVATGSDRLVASPVLVGGEVVTVTREGRVAVLDRADGSRRAAWTLPVPAGGRTDVEVPLGLVGSDLVITGGFTGLFARTVLYAYPIGPDSSSGVLLDLDPRVVPSPLTEPAVADGGDLLVPGYDGRLVRVGPDGTATPLLSNGQGVATGAVVAGDGGVVVARRDDQLVGVPASGGEPRWQVAAGAATVGGVPAASADGRTVYAATADDTLLAVAAADGTVRWQASTTPGFSPTTPLVLPGSGDVVYGGGLARLDAATGTAVWRIDDAQAFSPPAYSSEGGGLVLAQLTRDQHPSGLYAVDAATGDVRWTFADSPASYVGPVTADGVVVVQDALGVVAALDAATGAVLWTLTLDGAAGGTPVIRDGRVYLVEAGRFEDLDQRDCRVSVHDLRTGGYLGSWQPPGAVASIAPAAGPDADGDGVLLVPTSAGKPYVVAVTPHG